MTLDSKWTLFYESSSQRRFAPTLVNKNRNTRSFISKYAKEPNSQECDGGAPEQGTYSRSDVLSKATYSMTTAKTCRNALKCSKSKNLSYTPYDQPQR